MGRSAVATTSPEQIRTLENNLAALENQLQQLQQTQRELEHQLTMLEPELRDMIVTFEKCSAELKV